MKRLLHFATPRLGRARVRARSTVLLLLLAPQLFYAGHWSVAAHDVQTPAERTEHHQHCHTDVATCSGLPLPSGPGQLLFTEELLADPVLHAMLIESGQRATPAGLSARPLFPPPRTDSRPL